MDNTRLNHLEELKGSDFQIAEGMPDIQGWKIVDISGEKIGKVKDMLFDKEARKVRYIITTVNSDVDGLDDRDVLIPIGQAELDIPDEEVKIPTHTFSQLAGLPSYISGELTPEHEYSVRNTFLNSGTGMSSGTGAMGSGTMDTPYNRETFYTDESFDEGRFYNRERHSGGTQNLSGSGDINAPENLDRADEIDRAESLDRPINTEKADRFEDDMDIGRNKLRDDEDPFGREANDPDRI